MITVWKFEVPPPDPTGLTQIEAPVGARFLSVGFQDDVLVVWAETETEAPLMQFQLFALNTGKPLPRMSLATRYLGTVTTVYYGTVWHVWVNDG